MPELDRTDIPFVTIDPPSSMDLDQAVHLERDGDGYVVHYAIADVAAFATPGDPVDEEANRRGRRCTARTPRCPCIPRCSPKGRRRCFPTRTGRRCSGRSRSTARARGPTSTSYAPS